MTAIFRFVISGKVQGVGFRAYTADCAGRLRLSGFVRNRRDGTVEAFVEGATAEIDRFASLVALGPAGSGVERVERAELSTTQAPALPRAEFLILPTL